MLNIDKTGLVVIDIQAKLLPAIHDREAIVEMSRRMIQAAKIFDLPIIHTEQNPAGLGPTVPEIASLIDSEPITKTSFSCCGEPRFLAEVQKINRSQLLLLGIECHVCVHQTAVELTEASYEVHVIADAVSSRTAVNRRIGLAKMKAAGVGITSFETAVFELQRIAEGEKFKAILKLVK